MAATVYVLVNRQLVKTPLQVMWRMDVVNAYKAVTDYMRTGVQQLAVGLLTGLSQEKLEAMASDLKSHIGHYLELPPLFSQARIEYNDAELEFLANPQQQAKGFWVPTSAEFETKIQQAIGRGLRHHRIRFADPKGNMDPIYHCLAAIGPAEESEMVPLVEGLQPFP